MGRAPADTFTAETGTPCPPQESTLSWTRVPSESPGPTVESVRAGATWLPDVAALAATEEAADAPAAGFRWTAASRGVGSVQPRVPCRPLNGTLSDF